MSTIQREKDNGEVLRALDRITRLDGCEFVTSDDLARVACLSALIAAGMTVEADQVARRGAITMADALAALGLLLALNLSGLGDNVKQELERIGAKL